MNLWRTNPANLSASSKALQRGEMVHNVYIIILNQTHFHSAFFFTHIRQCGLVCFSLLIIGRNNAVSSIT